MIKEQSDKPYFKTIILVLGLGYNYNQIGKNARKIWKKYMTSDPQIKVFFVYGKLNNTLEDYDRNSDLVFPEIKDIYPTKIHTTIEAMKLIQENYTYDFFIRTNLSTFWDFKQLHDNLKDLPKNYYYCGDGPLPGYRSSGYYLSGADTIVTYNMIDSIIKNTDKINYDIVDDAAMGLYFNRELKVPMTPTDKICFFEDIESIDNFSKEKIENRIDDAKLKNKDHYRVKSKINREEIDTFIYNILLEKIYG